MTVHRDQDAHKFKPIFHAVRSHTHNYNYMIYVERNIIRYILAQYEHISRVFLFVNSWPFFSMFQQKFVTLLLLHMLYLVSKKREEKRHRKFEKKKPK